MTIVMTTTTPATVIMTTPTPVKMIMTTPTPTTITMKTSSDDNDGMIPPTLTLTTEPTPFPTEPTMTN